MRMTRATPKMARTDPKPQVELLTTREAANCYRGLSYSTLVRMRIAKVGPTFVKIGFGPRGRIYYRPRDLEIYMASCLSDAPHRKKKTRKRAR